MLTAASFVIAPHLKFPKGPVVEWVNKHVWYDDIIDATMQTKQNKTNQKIYKHTILLNRTNTTVNNNKSNVKEYMLYVLIHINFKNWQN